MSVSPQDNLSKCQVCSGMFDDQVMTYNANDELVCPNCEDAFAVVMDDETIPLNFDGHGQ